MGKTNIEWCDSSWTPIRGTKGRWHCVKISSGCTNCYAERLNIRFGGPKYVAGADVLRLDSNALEQPLHWKAPRMIFVCSMTDLFHPDVPREFISKIFEIMAMCKRHTFQVLTKHPGRMLAYQRWWLQRLDDPEAEWKSVYPNVWMGTSAENQPLYWSRVTHLQSVMAVVRWVSFEPLLQKIDASAPLAISYCEAGDFWAADEPIEMGSGNVVGLPARAPAYDWAVVGGESGPGARPMNLAWARLLLDQHRAAGVPFFFKQKGERINKGGDLADIPIDLRVRDWPEHVEMPADA